MKPPVVHQPVQPPRPEGEGAPEDTEGSVQPADSVAADDDRDVRYESTQAPSPGLVGDFGPLVDTPSPDRDGAADDERENP